MQIRDNERSKGYRYELKTPVFKVKAPFFDQGDCGHLTGRAFVRQTPPFLFWRRHQCWCGDSSDETDAVEHVIRCRLLLKVRSTMC